LRRKIISFHNFRKASQLIVYITKGLKSLAIVIKIQGETNNGR
jgi:hypothetical protein